MVFRESKMIGGCISMKTFKKMKDLEVYDETSTQSFDGCSTLDESEGRTEVSQTSEERREIMERSIFGGSCSQLSNGSVSSTEIELPVNATDEILLEKMKIQFKAAAYLTEQRQSVMEAKLVKSDDQRYEEIKKQAEKQINELEMEVKALKKIIALPEKPLLDICRKVMNKQPNS